MSFAVGDIVLLCSGGEPFRVNSVKSVTLETSYGYIEDNAIDVSRLLAANSEQCKTFYANRKKILNEQLTEISNELEKVQQDEANFLLLEEAKISEKSTRKKSGSRKKAHS